MTVHATHRAAERFPDLDPAVTMRAILAAIADGAPVVAISVTGEKIHEVWLPNGDPAFPVVAADGAVLTILTEGMQTVTTLGAKVMRAAGLNPGLHRLDAEVYHADPCPAPSLSSTLARLILNRSPLHAWTAHPRLNPAWEPTEKKTFDIGRAAHRAVLGAGGDYVAYPPEILASNGAASTKEAKAWAEDQRAAGRTPLKAEEVDQIGEMAMICHHRLIDYGITLDPAHSEVTAIAEIDGAWCRAMIDNAPADPRLPLLDFKTCEDASPDAVVRHVENYAYDVQAAHYLDVWKAATGEDRDFLFIFQEKEPPHAIAVVRLLNSAGHSGDWMEDAREKVHTARQTWAQCLKDDHWPAYPAMIIEIGARSFHRQKWQDTRDRSASARAIAAAQKFQAPENFA